MEIPERLKIARKESPPYFRPLACLQGGRRGRGGGGLGSVILGGKRLWGLEGAVDLVTKSAENNSLDFISGRRTGSIAVRTGFRKKKKEPLFFLEFTSFSQKKQQNIYLNFWPVRDHEKPSFRYVLITFFAILNI